MCKNVFFHKIERGNKMYCPNCGKDAGENKFCPACGSSVVRTPAQVRTPVAPVGLVCPTCGSTNVSTQVFQEESGSTTITKGKSKYKEKGHNILWWIFIGSWWWMIDLCLWIFAFPIKFLTKLFHKKKYKGKSKSVSHTVNHIKYKTMCTCQNCGHTWEKFNTSATQKGLFR